jgi:hypothetical protein
MPDPPALRRSSPHCAIALVAALAVALALSGASVRAAGQASFASGPLQTAIVDPYYFPGPKVDDALAWTRAAGATVARIAVTWATVAPGVRRKNFDPSNPTDPAYRWADVDRQVTRVVAAGLEPLVTLSGGAPRWAERATGPGPGINDPDPVEFGHFVTAATKRYGGTVLGLPRVRLWQAWNEPNYPLYLAPQFVNEQPVSPEIYRRLLDAFAQAAHAVHPDNVVAVAGLSPFGAPGYAVAPLEFMRRLLCMSADAAPKPTCASSVEFDAWAVHPYTQGGPLHSARNPDDVSLGDLPELSRLLRAAIAVGHVRAAGPVSLWVTEFSWDSKPPDETGVPLDLEGRWVAEAMFRMWSAGVSLVTWWTVVDHNDNSFQSGLYRFGTADAPFAAPKPAQRAFRFPFVAHKVGRVVTVWGRTPAGVTGDVAIERGVGGRWKRVATLHANRYGIFTSRLSKISTGVFRARMVAGRELSLVASLKLPPDLPVPVFGS